MNRQTLIENKLAESILAIDGTLQTGGYTYYNNVKVVNQEDITTEDEFPYVNIYIDPSEDVLSSIQRVYTNRVHFVLECIVSNDGEELRPKFAINERMGNILSDIKHNLGLNSATLFRTVSNVKINRSTRIYDKTNNNYNTGILKISITVEYNQSMNNPDSNICK